MFSDALFIFVVSGMLDDSHGSFVDELMDENCKSGADV